MLMPVSYFRLPKRCNFSELLKNGFLRQERNGRSWISVGYLGNVYSKLI